MVMSASMEASLREPKRIGRMLIDEGLIEPHELREALDVQKARGGKTVEILVHLGHLDLDSVCKFLASRGGIASIDLQNYSVPRDLAALVPKEFALKHEVFPIDKMGNCLTVAMSFPIDLATIQDLEHRTGLRVSALLCHATDIRQAIRRYYSGEDDTRPAEISGDALREQFATGLRMENVVQTVRQIEGLPTLPQTVQRVQEAMADAETLLKDIAEIVQQDPPIAARLLQLANSAAYGFLSRVSNVQSAITLLGLRETYMAVLSSAVLDVTAKGQKFDHEQYWRSSMFAAGAARKIAAACSQGRNPAVFTAGLLSDLGRYALSQAAPARYAKIDQSVIGADLVEAEEQTLGIGHPEAGHILAVHWNLPDDLATAIRFHHRPQFAGEHRMTTGIAALSAIMTDAHRMGLAPDESVFENAQTTLDILGMDVSRATDVYAAVRTPEMVQATR
jgi:HD-like signal output (HDOD) protein